MDRAIAQQHLALAERHVDEGERHIQRQRELIRELQRDGHDTSIARKLLRTFEDIQTTHLFDPGSDSAGPVRG